jgi:hypothetical protein
LWEFSGGLGKTIKCPLQATCPAPTGKRVPLQTIRECGCLQRTRRAVGRPLFLILFFSSPSIEKGK